MIRQNEMTYEGVDSKGYALRPGVWIETWALMAGVGIWILVHTQPKVIAA